MNTKHVPSLELCQELDRLCKEKGIVVPETEFYYKRFSPHSKNYDLCDDGDEQCIHSDNKKIPAPLVSEQGEWLPEGAHTTKYNDCQRIGAGFAFSSHETVTPYDFEEGTEANARQKMINYLIAEGIITKL